MKLRPTKVSKEDIELADEISRVTTIKELVNDFVSCLETTFVELQDGAEKDNPVIVYKKIVAAKEDLISSAQLLQAQLLLFLGIFDLEGEIDNEDALTLLPSSVSEADRTAGTMDAALELTEPVVEIQSEEK